MAYNDSISCPSEINYTTQKVIFLRQLFTITSFNITFSVEAFEGTPEGTYRVDADYDLYTYISVPFGTSYTHLLSYRIRLDVSVVTKYASDIQLSAVPQSIRSGDNVSISGAITSEGGITISEANVYLTYRKPDGSSFTRALNTSSVGSLHETYRPDMPGSWSVNATWQGNEDHNPAESPTITFDVLTDLTHAFVWENKTYNVRTLTNSTLQDFAFDQSLRQISFSVGGPPNTTGSCNVTIPKSFLKGEPWMITVNGDPVTHFTETENATHTSLHFTYFQRSTYTVVIQGTWVVPEILSPMILALLMVCCLFSVLMAKRTSKSKLDMD